MPDREPCDLVIEARWLLPMQPAGAVLEDHAVAVSAGRIAAVAPVAEIRSRFAAGETLVRDSHALLPGLVNACTNAADTLLRAHAGARPAGSAGADFVRDGTRVAMAEMLRAGITSFADLGPNPDEAARAASAAQMRAAIALPVAEGPSAWAEDATGYFARAERLWDQYRSDPRISLFFAPLELSSLSDGGLARLRRLADELDARVALDVTGAADLSRLEALGLLRPGATVIGLGSAEAHQVPLLVQHGASLVACPQAQLRAGRFPFAPSLPGAHTGLGSGSAGYTGVLDILAQARLAAGCSALPAAEALRMATLGGATALGLQAEIGSIEPGKAADLVCVDLSSLECRMAPGIPEAVLFGATRAQVSDVWTGGRCAVSGAHLLAFDEAEIAVLPERWRRRLKLEAAA